MSHLLVDGPTSAVGFLGALREQQLLADSQLAEIERESHCDEPRSLAQEMIERGWLTPFQAEHVLKGTAAELALGPYRLLAPLGEGGMGQVFKARHQRLKRVVALKVIRQDVLSQDAEVVRRFQREAQAAAQLSHPNVVLVYDADQVGAIHFIAMEYVEGTDLSHLVSEIGPLPMAHACDYVRQAALGLQHAHEHGLVHRDIKPSNLLLTQAMGSKPPGFGVVKILDMGLVRLVEPGGANAKSSLTQAGIVMGTPDYIAPEQARDPRNVDIRADLYSLGCTFYFLLAGQPPFQEGGAVEKLLMHQLDEPRPVAELRPEVPAEVVAILGKLLAKRPEHRYQEPKELALALAELTVTDGARVAPADSKERPAGEQGQQATVVFHIAPAETPATAPPSSANTAVAGPEPAQQIALLQGHRGWVMSLAFTADRNVLATGGMDGVVHLRSFSSRFPSERTLPQSHNGEVHSLAFSPDSRTLAVGSGALDGRIWLWDLSRETPRRKAVLAGHEAPVETLAFTPDGKLLASGSCDKTLRLWDLEEPRERAILYGHTDHIHAAAFAPDGKLLASGSQDGTIRLWSMGRIWSSEQAVLAGHSGPVRSLAFAANGHTLASGGLDPTVILWNLSAEQPRKQALLEGHLDVVRLLLFPPDGQTLVSVGDRCQVILWDLLTCSKRRDWPTPGLMASSVAFTHDGRYLAVGKSDGTVAVFRLYPKKKS